MDYKWFVAGLLAVFLLAYLLVVFTTKRVLRTYFEEKRRHLVEMIRGNKTD